MSNTNKTQPTKMAPADFVAQIEDTNKRNDCQYLLELMGRITSKDPVMWGPSIVGFDQYHYKYESGREGDFFVLGFSPRKQNLTLYIMDGFAKYVDLLTDLGKHKTGKSCLYIKRLSDINLPVLNELLERSFAHFKAKYG